MDDIELEIDTPAQDSFNAPADEDQDMEEGEIATPDDQDLRLNLNRRKPLHERLGPRVPKGATFGIENDIFCASRYSFIVLTLITFFCSLVLQCIATLLQCLVDRLEAKRKML